MSIVETSIKNFRPCFLNRILQRWIECWRLAAASDPGGTRTGPTSKISMSSTPKAAAFEANVPKPGMRGKNVEWVPCSPVVLDKMLDMAHVTADDYVIDPGSGDGRIVIRVAKRGARALGIESNARLVALSRKAAVQEGVADLANFIVGDFYKVDFSKATVLTLFLRRDINLKLRPRILDMSPGTRVVSNIFDMGDWEADQVVKVEDGDYYFRNHTVRLWNVPSKVQGIWKFPQGELAISQKFQMIGGVLRIAGKTASIEGKLTADHLVLTANSQKYAGRVAGDRMMLEEKNGSKVKWIAKFHPSI